MTGGHGDGGGAPATQLRELWRPHAVQMLAVAAQAQGGGGSTAGLGGARGSWLAGQVTEMLGGPEFAAYRGEHAAQGFGQREEKQEERVEAENEEPEEPNEHSRILPKERFYRPSGSTDSTSSNRPRGHEGSGGHESTVVVAQLLRSLSSHSGRRGALHRQVV